jgi:tetratricopeptide (TPR) repeat protein
MSDTRMDDPQTIIPNRVRGYERVGGQLRNSEYVNVSSRFAAGGTRSTVLDLLKFVRGIADGKVLKKETVDDMWTERATRAGAGIRYGLGWTVDAGGGHFRVGHTGSQQETRTQLSYVPRQRFAVALASNYEDARLGLFTAKLAELFLGDAEVELYTDDKTARPTLAAVSGVFAEGLAYYDRYRRPLTEDPKEIAAAFDYFNRAAGDERMARQGRDPAAGRPWAAVGSYMAHALITAGKASLETSQREGPLRLFADYVALYRSGRSWPASARFAAATERRISAWAVDWARVWPEAPLRDVADAADLARVEAARDRWQASSVRPAYRSLITLGEDRAEQGDVALGTRAARLAAELYPDSDAAHGLLGVLTLMAGDRAGGESLVRRAAALRKDGYVAPANLSSIATILARQGSRAAAVALLEIAVAVHPSDATLQVRLAQLYRDAGDPENALAAYQAALRIDPTSKEAQAGLAELRH